MKKILLSLAAIALMMSACTQEVIAPNGNNTIVGGNVTITATATPETRTAMAANANGGLEISWVTGDAIGLFGEISTEVFGFYDYNLKQSQE